VDAVMCYKQKCKVVSLNLAHPVSPPLSGATENCFIVQVQQLQMLYRRRCCKSASQRMFGSLWNVVVARKPRRQDGSRRLGTMAKCQTATRWTSVPVASGGVPTRGRVTVMNRVQRTIQLPNV